ncbi:hypothetical protein KI440_03825 [Candidatus Saccharibacteria bacterium TM7i]|nr:hypothetical protein KI440_03825 [Candidatus Saccharibacteria bacterium TM7i]
MTEGSSGIERVMVAALLDKHEAGDTFTTLPLHLTYVSWFNLPTEQRNTFHEYVQEVTELNRAPVVTGGSLQYFTKEGSRERVPVRRLDVPTVGLHALNDFSPHAELMRFAQDIDPDFDDTYFGLNWRPHISSTADREFAQGEVAQLESLSVIRKDLKIGRKVVDRVYRWGI